MTLHILIRTSNTPPLFKALCGFTSDNAKDYRKDRQPLSVVTCETCVKKLGRVVEPVVEWRVK